MSRVGKGCSGVETPLFKGMIGAKELENQGHVEEQGDEEEQGNGNNAAEEPITVVNDVIAQSTQSPTPLTPPAQQPQDIPLTSQRIESSADTIMEDVSNHRRMTEESDKDEGAKVVNEEEETEEVRDNAADAKVKGRQADIYHIDMDQAAKVLSMQEEEQEVQEAVEFVTTAKLITQVVDAVSGTVSAAAVIPAPVTAATISPALVKVDVPATKRRRGAKFNANLEFLLKTKEQIEEEESRAIVLINETPAQKVAKRRKLNKEVKDVEAFGDYGQDNVWKDQRSAHGQALVKSWKLLTSLRLQVEEQSEISLELIRFTRQQLQEVKILVLPGISSCYWILMLISAAEKNDAAKSSKDC
nr:hypothetical protein [Tanacetum cinerariifolium]